MSEFLAEARILVRPDTTKFRAELEAQLKAVTAKPITVPVVAAVTPAKVTGVAAAAQAAAAGQQSVAAAAQEAGAAAQVAAASTVKLTVVQTAAAAAAEKLALAQREVLGAETAVASARTTLTRSTAAVLAAEKAYGLALRSNDAAVIASTKETLGLATAQEQAAVAALSSARAQKAAAAEATQVNKAAAAAATAASREQAAAAKLAAAEIAAANKAAAVASAAAAKEQAAAQKAAAAEVAASNKAATVAAKEQAAAQKVAAAEIVAANKAVAASAAVAAREQAAAAAAQASSLRKVAQGASASGLTLFGLRGATLAASGAFLAGTAAVVGFSKAIQSAASLETELNVFRVTAGATADEMKRVSDTAKELGRDITLPGVSANDAAVALTELSKAGLSVQDSLDGAKGVLQLATAAQIDFVDASKAVAGALNAFGLAGSDAVKVADLLAGAAKESQGEISDFNTALGQTALVADKFGLSMGDTVTILTELAQAGLLGGRAGTSLRVAILNLVSPSVKAGEALEKLKVNVLDIDGKFRPQIFTDIARALQSYSVEQRNATLRTIFGTDSIKTYLAVASKGPAAFKQVSDAVNEAGLAQELAGARTQGFQGDVENLANQVETLGLNIGQVAKGPIGLLVRGLGAATGAINETTAAAEKKGVFEAIGQAIGDFASSAERLGRGFNRAVIASTQASTAFTVFDAVAKSVTDTTNALADALDKVAAKQRVQGPQDSGLGVKQIQNVIGGFDAKAVRDKINKDNGQLLADLQAEQDFLQRQLQRQFVKNRPALQRLIEQALLGTVNEIDSVQSKASTAATAVRQKAEKAASDAAAAVRNREQALLNQFGVTRDQRQNLIDADAVKGNLTKQVADEKILKGIVLKQIAAIKERISVEGGRAAAVASLRAILNQIDGQLKSLAQQQQAAAAERRQNLIQGTSLDIDLAQITGNQQAEVAARKKLISQLKAQQALVKRGTVEWKELRNRIAEQNAAIAGVTAEKRKQGQSFAQASFEFLQAQQGFASNLLGNLIPSGATSGLVGGGSVQTALTPVAGAAEGMSRSGPTSGQANAANSILNGILQQLKILNGDNAAPEAARQNRGQRSVMDGVGGG